MEENIADILDGSNDELLLEKLYCRIQHNCNSAQARFAEAWELTDFIASDGFEILFEQGRPVDDYAKLLITIGFPQAAPIFEKLNDIVPTHLYLEAYTTETREHLTKNFERLKELLHEYFDVTETGLLDSFGKYIRDHREDFADLFAETSEDR